MYEVYQSAATVSSIDNENELSDPTKDCPLLYFKPQDKWLEKWSMKLKAKQDSFTIKDGHVWKKVNANVESWVKFIPFKRRADLVEDSHRGFGHQATTTIDHLMKSRFWWPQMNQDIKNWLVQCHECQLHARNKKNIHHAPMKPLEIPPPFARWHIDFIGILPTIEAENKWIIMAVDYNTNWPIARPLKEATATEIVKFIYEKIVMRFGCPVELVSDRGANFMSKILNHYMKKIKAKHVFTSAFHSRTNSKCERLNQTFKRMITKYVKGDTHSWDEFIETALFACRIIKHRTTGPSPFFMVYDVDPVIPGDILRSFLDPHTEEGPELFAEDALTHLRNLREQRYLPEDQ